MRRLAILLIPLILAGCLQKKRIMTAESYAEVDMGMSIKDVVSDYGRPYAIYSKGTNAEIYEYIERYYRGTYVAELRRYFFVVTDGKVVGKYIKWSSPPPYDAIYSDDPYPNY